MPTPRKLPATPVLVALAQAGYTNPEIGAVFHVSRQAVSMRLAGIPIVRAARLVCPACAGQGDVPPVALRDVLGEAA